VYGFTAEDYPTWVESLFPEGFNPRNAKDVALKRALDSSTVTVDLDSAGRVALGKVPTEARCSRGLDKAVTVIGSGDHFEVWDTERWEREQASLSADLSALMFDAS
jgi:MraZ protein